MSERFRASIDILTAAGNDDRFILAGSVGRAGLLGDADFPLQTRHADRDLDVIDSANWAQKLYEFADAAPIDAQMTRRFRPFAEEKGGRVWGMFDPVASPDEPPVVTVSEELLGVHEIRLPFRSAQTTMRTFSACGHLTLRNLMLDQSRNLKHPRQYRAISRDIHDPESCTCSELKPILSRYHEILRARRPQTAAEVTYAMARSAVKVVAPDAFKLLQSSKIGTIIRRVRGTSEGLERTLGSILDEPDLAPRI